MDARLREGIRLFNAGRYFESHESLEDFYLHTEQEHKPFLEGLIQLAAALRLFSDFAETKGPVRMVRQALIRLENYQPTYLGVRVKKLTQTMDVWTREMEATETAKTNSAPRAPMPKIPLQRFLFF